MSTSISHIITPETEYEVRDIPDNTTGKFSKMIVFYHGIGNTAYIFFEGDQFEKFKDAINKNGEHS